MTSVTKQSQQERLLQLFTEEAQEHLLAINGALIELEARRGEPRVLWDTMLRAAHSVKGAASAAGLTQVSKMLHNWESCAQALRATGELSGTPLELLYRALDAIEAQIQEQCTGVRPKTAAVDPSVAELKSHFGSDVQLVSVEAQEAAEPEPEISELPRVPSDEAGSIRVATDKIQRLMSGVEDLVAVKSGGEQRIKDARQVEGKLERTAHLVSRLKTELRHARLNGSASALLEELTRVASNASELGTRLSQDVRRLTHDLDSLSGRLQGDIRAVRMIPVAEAFAALPRVARDIGRKLGKSVQYELAGGETEIDRDLVDAIKDPMTHLVRNAIAHGLETDAVRSAAGKPVIGTVRVEAVGRAGGLQLSIRDDGAGIDLPRVRQVAVERGLVAAKEAAGLDRQQATQLLFQPGFSTAAAVDEVSGRGVGLDVVRQRVERCGGSVLLETTSGMGTEFIIRLPLNLTSMRMLLTRVGSELYALPINAVVRIQRVGSADIHRIDSGLACEIDGAPVRIERLAPLLGVDGHSPNGDRSPAVVLSSGATRVAILVDAIEGEHDLIVKGLGDHLGQVPLVAGATVLASGRIVPLLSVSDLVAAVSGSRQARPLFAAQNEGPAKRHRILIVDDSITTRTLESSILEAVGYEVDVATDGVDALAKLSRGKFDLVLSDFQMPRMDGLELVSRIKADPTLNAIPVILVSSISSAEDKVRGLKAGADAYLGKQEFTQELLLETLERFL